MKEFIKYTDFLAFYFYQKLAYVLLLSIKNYDFITPNKITLFALIFGIFSAYFIYVDQLFLAFLFLNFSFVFDCLDGQLARYKKMSSEIGMWLDNIVDRIVENLILIAIVFHYDMFEIGVITVFINMFYSYISDLEIYQNIKYKKLNTGEKIIFSPVYFLNRSYIIVLLSFMIFSPFLIQVLLILYGYGIFYKIYRKLNNGIIK